MIHDLKRSAPNKGKSVGRAADFQDRKALLDSLGDDDDGETESHANVPHVENIYNSNNWFATSLILVIVFAVSQLLPMNL